MRDRGGAIVNVGSGVGFYAVDGLAAYGAATAGLVALARSVALEAGPTVRVNTVVPGPTDPGEIADAIVWIASGAASAVNGALLRVDDGHHMI
jgi:NAD(P)-dependent dehydrogenase (short-subunit alcohol dehydrogenase family)